MRLIEDVDKLTEKSEILSDIKACKEIVWINEEKTDFNTACEGSELSMKDVDDAEERLMVFTMDEMNYLWI